MTRVGYLVSDFAAPSHTFVRREVAAVRALGTDVLAYSVQRTPSPPAGVESLLGRSAAYYAAALLTGLFATPVRFLTAWRLAITHRPAGLRGLLWSQFHFVEAIVLARLVRAGGVTWLHVHFANSAATVGLIAADYARIPFSLTLHGISETDAPAGQMLGAKIERAQFVACASYFMRAQALRMVDVQHWSKCHVVRCGVDLAALPAPRRGPVEKVPQLICVGRLSMEKGHFGLLDALGRLKGEGLDFAVTIVGDGPCGDDLRSRCTRLGLDDRVRFSGPLSESQTLNLIAAADTLLLASLMEGLPVVLIEALALEKPVLAPRIAGIPELVDDGKSGVLFTPSDWDDLARRLRAFLACHKHWQEWGAAGRARVELEFRIETSAARMVALFRGREA